ncbi:MAG: Eco29kI family restriction endonuclease [Bacteroidales bacterium]|nr:Eco29kI family restriction endonuclease [Bacteroidales bacterium]
MNVIFDRSKHVFRSDVFAEIIKDTIRFFNGTPVHLLPPPENFIGAGVYAIYYIGESPLYKHLYEANRISFEQPIYVGKAVPRGWRQARLQEASNELFTRLNDHENSIVQAKNLRIDDFRCRFMILEDAAADMIGTVEASLIRQYKPIWNSCIDGFGNHDPGSGRYDQAKSDWDILHPGREWADRLRGEHTTQKEIKRKALAYYNDCDE